jgi:hypothetical protein
MRIFLVFFLLISLPSFSQKDSIEIAVRILPQLYSSFRNAEITCLVSYNNGKQTFDIDTNVIYPFNLRLPITKANDTITILLRSELDLDEHGLVKFFFVFGFLPISDTSSNKIAIDFPENCDYNTNFKNKVCRVCTKSDEVIPVIYGLPLYDKDGRSPFDSFEHYLWGCDMPSCGPTWHCKRDKIEF